MKNKKNPQKNWKKNLWAQNIYYAQIKKPAQTNYRRQFVLDSELVAATLNGVPVKLLQ